MASSSSSRKRSYTEYEKETFTVSYDAFINHRGPDVKQTVAFALYESLEDKGFWTFLDDQELQLGDSIESVIKKSICSSKVQIAIFSPDYPTSPWCLNELVLMLKTKGLFIPVFCDVKPSDLRYSHKGVYAPAFAKHKKQGRFSNKQLRQWKEALQSSSGITGHIFSTSNDNVEMLCTKIVWAVQREIGKKGFPRDVKVTSHQMVLHADAAALTSTPAQVKKSCLLPRDAHPVGIHSKVEYMTGLLKNPQGQVIAVVGMGGSGKTFLLQYVYKALKSRYHHSIWLSISKSYSVKNLQRDIASHIDLKREIVEADVTEERAAVFIHDRLQGKSSLIVLDDLWTLSREDNLIDKLGLPDDKDCKVVVSTRNRKVAENSSARIYEMKNLSGEDSWKLFCIYAFPHCEENRAPSYLEAVGREIVKQCGNLPLAIKTTAASLANTTSLSKWESKRSQLENAIIPIGHHDPVMDILKLSYDSLPAHLKACFAYLSFFPEDEDINCEYLVNLWIGEGFIPGGAGEEQWDMAWDWLDQLANLCLLQLWEAKEEARLTKYCKIHDLLYDLAIHISRKNKCVFSVEEASTHTSSALGWCRLLLAKKDIHVNSIAESRPVYLRTLSLSQNSDITRIPENLFTAMRGLRILDLSSTSISTLPVPVGKMILLKVLNLRGTKIEEVPECVRHLKSLLFLAMSDRCEKLPVWISELKCLQHLECEGVDRIPKGISNLASLRILRSGWLFLSIEEDGFMRLEDLASLTQLQELWLIVNHDIQLKRMEQRILAQLIKMRHLEIRSEIRERSELPQFPYKMRAMKHLESLALERFAVPSWICDFANLRELELYSCECSDYPELQRMPNLESLWIQGNFSCTELPKAFGKSGGFPHLRFFTISNLDELEEFPELEEGAMGCLEELDLLGCLKVKKMGEGLERLKRLKEFYYYGSGTNEVRQALKKGGKYWNKIKANNPHITISGY